MPVAQFTIYEHGACIRYTLHVSCTTPADRTGGVYTCCGVDSRAEREAKRGRTFAECATEFCGRVCMLFASYVSCTIPFVDNPYYHFYFVEDFGVFES